MIRKLLVASVAVALAATAACTKKEEAATTETTTTEATAPAATDAGAMSSTTAPAADAGAMGSTTAPAADASASGSMGASGSASGSMGSTGAAAGASGTAGTSGSTTAPAGQYAARPSKVREGPPQKGGPSCVLAGPGLEGGMSETPSPLLWQDGQPRSRLFGDIYYSLEDGLSETRTVFLEGCGLPGAWAGRRRFSVAELGFGTGLNIAALLDLWSRTRPAGGHLHIFSVEAYPLPRDEAAAALGAWPEIGEAAEALLDRWPGKRRGFHRLDLPEFSAVLDLAIMDVAVALEAWSGAADAWFLDGFSPALNPDMWREDILGLVGARSAPGAVAATFTVAGAVRRGLAAAGFDVAKRPGHGRKRERLEARMPGPPTPTRDPRVLIVGGGIAGASLARAFAALGAPARVVRDGAEVMASGNRAALVAPAVDAGGGARAAFYAQALARAAALYDATPGAVVAEGAVQLEAARRDTARFDAVAGQDLFEPGAVSRLSAGEAARQLGEAVAPGALMLRGARVVAPKTVLAAWLPEAVAGRVVGLGREGAAWRATLADGTAIEADVVVLAGGWGSAALAPDLSLQPVRGQATYCPVETAVVASASGAYAIPSPGGVLFGATHDREDVAVDVRVSDDERNRTTLRVMRPALAAALAGRPAEGRASIRATTPDRMPIAGEMAPGLFVLTGLGSRGFTTAPLLAEHVAALVLGAPSPLPTDGSALVAPARLRA
jgi:tRNA 5-methylaminomethyl-2-thiouridine biosynthesis bifunctional protein